MKYTRNKQPLEKTHCYAFLPLFSFPALVFTVATAALVVTSFVVSGFAFVVGS